MKSILTGILATTLLCFALPVLADDSEPDFKLVNMTGTAIDGVFISAPGANAFTKNELVAPIAAGTTFQVKYSSPAKLCVLDTKITWDSGKKSEIISAKDLCKADKITLTIDTATGKASHTIE
ncbi:MAG: hypothetical protein WCF85_20280 [Rhodospirillaceae bacterium]